jgi:hypothetical protein
MKPPFGSFLGLRSLSLTFVDFGTVRLRLFVFEDLLDLAFIVLASFELIRGNIYARSLNVLKE